MEESMLRRRILLFLPVFLAVTMHAQTSCPEAPLFTLTSSCRVPYEGQPQCRPDAPAIFRLVQPTGNNILVALDACQSVTWSFGDGSPDVTTAEPTATHAYASAGVQIVKAKINSAGGSRSQAVAIFSAAGWFDLAYINVGDNWPTERIDPAVEFVFERNTTEGSADMAYATQPDDANVGVRYPATAGTLHFGPGERVKAVFVPLLNDNVYRGSADLPLRFSSATDGYGVFGIPPLVARVRIEDDDLPTVRLSGDTFRGSESAGSVAVTVDIDGAYEVPIKFYYHLYGEKWPSPPWKPPSGTVDLSAGTTRKTFTVPSGLVNDLLYEGNRETQLVIDHSDSAKASGGARLIVEDDDPTPVLSVDDLQVAEGSPGVQAPDASATLHLSSPAKWPLRYSAGLVPGTATVSDLGLFDETLVRTIPAGVTEWKLQLPLIRDTEPEPNESFELVLKQADAVPLIGRGRATVTILNDDTKPALLPRNPQVIAGDSLTMQLVLPAPASTFTTFTIYNLDTSVFTTPEQISIEQGSDRVIFQARALKSGRATLSVITFDGSTSSEITVIQTDAQFGQSSPFRGPSDSEIVLTVVTTTREFLAFDLESSNPGVLQVPPAVGTAGRGDFFAHSGPPGTATVTLRSPGGSIVRKLDVIVFQKPVASLITPKFGVPRGGTPVTISGVGFTPDCSVRFQGSLATNVTLTAAGTLTAITPPNSAGKVPVSVRCQNVESTLPQQFTYANEKARSARH
jgi:PKD repeat protein